MSVTPAISPLVSSVIPRDIKIKYLACLTVPELCKSGEVCKEWFELSRDKVIWIPIFTQLNPFAKRQFIVGGQEDIKSEVLCDLQKKQTRVNQVISLIDDDEQLASIIGHSSPSLKDLRKMLPIERTWHVMRGLRKDCTQFLVYLPKKHMSDMDKQAREKYTVPGFHEGLAQRIVFDFYRDDKSLPFLLECVKAPFGPFDAGEAMSAILPLFQSYPAVSPVMNICANIVKSHPDLSSFFKTKFRLNMGDPSKENFIPMEEVISRVVIPKMKELGLDVTMDDWIKCGFVPPPPSTKLYNF